MGELVGAEPNHWPTPCQMAYQNVSVTVLLLFFGEFGAVQGAEDALGIDRPAKDEDECIAAAWSVPCPFGRRTRL